MLQPRKRVEHIAHGLCLSGANANIARNAQLLVAQLGLGLFHKRKNLLRALAQAHAVTRKHARTVGALEQLHAQLALQIGYLARKRGLRHMQNVCRLGHILLARDRQKVP